MGINYIMISDEILKSETLSVPAKFVAMIMLYVSNNNLKTNVFEKTLVERFGYSEEYYSKYLNELANHANKYITITRKFLNGKTKNSYTLNYLNPKDYKIIPFNLFNILGETADRDIMKNGKKCYKTIKFDSNAFVYYAKLKLYINSSTLERDDWRKSDIEKFLKTNKPTNNKYLYLFENIPTKLIIIETEDQKNKIKLKLIFEQTLKEKISDEKIQIF